MQCFVEWYDKSLIIAQETVFNEMVTERSMNRTAHGYSSDKAIDSIDETLDTPENETTEINEISIEIF